MKRLFLLLFILLSFISVCYAGMIIQTVAAVGGDSPSGTYELSWNGDYPSDTDKACEASGVTQLDGTIGGAATISATYGETGNGLRVENDDDKLYYTKSINVTTGTLWVRLNIRTADIIENVYSVGAEYDGDNNIVFRFRTSETLQVQFEYGGTLVDVVSTGTISANTWAWYGYSWDLSGTDKHSVYIDGAWEEEVEALGSFTNAPNVLYIGRPQTIGGAHTTEYWIDNFFYVDGTYQASAPSL